MFFKRVKIVGLWVQAADLFNWQNAGGGGQRAPFDGVQWVDIIPFKSFCDGWRYLYTDSVQLPLVVSCTKCQTCGYTDVSMAEDQKTESYGPRELRIETKHLPRWGGTVL